MGRLPWVRLGVSVFSARFSVGRADWDSGTAIFRGKKTSM